MGGGPATRPAATRAAPTRAVPPLSPGTHARPRKRLAPCLTFDQFDSSCSRPPPALRSHKADQHPRPRRALSTAAPSFGRSRTPPDRASTPGTPRPTGLRAPAPRHPEAAAARAAAWHRSAPRAPTRLWGGSALPRRPAPPPAVQTPPPGSEPPPTQRGGDPRAVPAPEATNPHAQRKSTNSWSHSPIAAGRKGLR